MKEKPKYTCALTRAGPFSNADNEQKHKEGEKYKRAVAMERVWRALLESEKECGEMNVCGAKKEEGKKMEDVRDREREPRRDKVEL